MPKHDLALFESENKPTDKALWSRAKAEAKKRFRVWPSAYGSSWAVRWYGERGGKWTTTEGEIIVESLDKWFKERWVDISRKVGGKHPPCGDSHDKAGRDDDVTRAYPKCVPAKVAKSMSKKEKESATRRKREVERGPSGDRKAANFVSTKPKNLREMLEVVLDEMKIKDQ